MVTHFLCFCFVVLLPLAGRSGSWGASDDSDDSDDARTSSRVSGGRDSFQESLFSKGIGHMPQDQDTCHEQSAYGSRQ